MLPRFSKYLVCVNAQLQCYSDNFKVYDYFQGIKDYVDQQKRLHQDITKKLEENRDVFFKKQNENNKIKKQTEEKRKENESSDHGISFIASEDKVKRPMLLYMPDCPPEVSLDSPICTQEPEYIPLTSPPNNVISTPPSEIILSPQYCPSVKARKIFTVSKVKGSPHSPSAPSVPLILSPAIEIPSLPNALPILPLQPMLIASSGDIPDTTNSAVPNGREDNVNVTSIPKLEPLTVADLTNALVDESVNHILNQIICDDAKTVIKNKSNTTEMVDPITNSHDTVETLDQNALVTINSNVESDNILVPSDTKNNEGNISTLLNSANCDSDNGEAGNVQLFNEKCAKTCDSDSESKIGNIASLQNLTNGCDLKHMEKPGVTGNDSGVGINDCEQWTSVGDSVKPNFQTSLTLNGLTQELANAIEGLDVSPDRLADSVVDNDSIQDTGRFG